MEIRPRLQQVERKAGTVRTGGEPLPGVRQLAVIRNDRLGDTVLTLPAVDALRRSYPSARIGFVVAPRVAPLARLVPPVDEVIEAAPSASELTRQLREFGADLVVCIARGAAAAWATARCGATQRVGTGRRLYSFLFRRRVPEPRREGSWHEVEYALSFAHRAGAVGGPARFPIRPSEASMDAAGRTLRGSELEGRFVVIHPGSGGSCPAWPVEHFLELARMLSDQDHAVLLSVGPGEDRVRRAIESSGSEIRRLPRVEADLPLLTALLGRAALVVGNSSGPVHVAAALGTPTLAIHAPWSTCGVARWGPYGENGWGLVVDRADGAEWTRADRRRYAGEWMAALRPETVCHAGFDLVAGREPRIRA